MAAPTKAERLHMQTVAGLGCIICAGPCHVHHALTGGGGRKNHMKVLPLCHYHHQGPEGIHTLSRRIWEAKYGTEEELLEEVDHILRGMV